MKTEYNNIDKSTINAIINLTPPINSINLTNLLLTKSFIQNNPTKIETIDNKICLINSEVERISNLLQQALEEETKTIKHNSIIPEISEDLIDVDEDSIIFDKEDIYIKPSESFTMNSFLNNIFILDNIKYRFNPSIPQSKQDEKSDKIRTETFEIISKGDNILFPTKYKAVCSHKTKDGFYCGHVVYFNDLHKNSTIYCNSSERHIIKNVDSALIHSSITLYTYYAKKLNNIASVNKDEEQTEIVLYSLQELKTHFVEANVIYSGRKNETFLLVIAANNEEANLSLDKKPKKLKSSILLSDKQSYSFLHDIFESIKNYMKTYHNIKITNRNRVIAEFIILQLLCNKYLNLLLKAGYYGKSGSGKSFWSKVLLPLFTNSYVVVNGNDVTRNRLLGGRSNNISSMFNSPYLSGFVASNEVVFLEEMTNQLAAFFEAQTNRNYNLSSNIFSMLKGLDAKYQEYDVGIQGSKKSRIVSSIIMVGNLEQLGIIRNFYIKEVRMKYNLFNKDGKQPKFSSKWPLYKSVEFYSTVMKNEALAKSHHKVRQDLLPLHYITLLPQAEQSRLAIQIIVEDNETGFKPRELNSTISIQKYLHRTEFISELDKKFSRANNEVPEKLFQQINTFLETIYFPKRRNNIIIDTSMDYNIHLRESQVRMMSALVWLNKLYWLADDVNLTKELIDELSKLTNDDKVLIEYYERFNYNTLTEEEASMVKQPLINDLYYNTDAVSNETMKLTEESIVSKLKQELQRFEQVASENIEIK